MQETSLNLEILSPERVVLKTRVSAVGLPGRLGYMAILPGHAAMVAELDSGILKVSQDHEPEQQFFVSGGFVEVHGAGSVRVLVDSIERPSEIDRKRAEEAKKRAEGRLFGRDSSGTGSAGVDYSRATKALKRAETRLSLGSN